jgi:hypothetical protein
MKTYGGVEAQRATTFDLGTRWSWVVSFTPQPLCPQGKSPGYLLHSRLAGAPEPIWSLRRREKSLAPFGNRIPIPRLCTVVRSPPLYQMRYPTVLAYWNRKRAVLDFWTHISWSVVVTIPLFCNSNRPFIFNNMDIVFGLLHGERQCSTLYVLH